MVMVHISWNFVKILKEFSPKTTLGSRLALETTFSVIFHHCRPARLLTYVRKEVIPEYRRIQKFCSFFIIFL